MVLRVDLSSSGQSPSAASLRRARAWIEVDLDALQANVRALFGRLRRGCRLIAVVKGDAYGHGAVEVARAAVASGAAGLAVADAQEGAELRAAGVDAEILIIGPSLPDDVPVILEHRLVPAVADREFARVLDRLAERPTPAQIEVDTGLRRHGVEVGEAADLVRHLRGLKSVRLTGVYTHFSAITPQDRAAAAEQFGEFGRVLRSLRGDGLRLFAHACNTLSSILLPDAHLDAVRIGGGLHGLGTAARSLGLTPTLTLKSRVVMVRRVASGDRVGYGGTHVCERDTSLAVLPCGYADGMPRGTWCRTDVLIRGCRAPIVGLVSMNQTIVDVGQVPGGVAPGDEVVLLGAQGRERILAEERVAPGESSYEVTTLLHPNLPRLHRGGASGPKPGREVPATGRE